MTPNLQALVDAARPLLRNMTLGREDYSAATVAAAIRTVDGNTHTGVCVHLSCGIGFCAEHAAAAEMLKAGETQIEAIVAVADDGLRSPCGRCREFLIQIDPRNAEAIVILEGPRQMKLRDLLPEHWMIPPNAVP